MDAHPDRVNLWNEYAVAAFAAIRRAADVLESSPRQSSSRAQQEVRAMVEDLGRRRAQWAATHDTPLGEDDSAFAALTKRLQRPR